MLLELNIKDFAIIDRLSLRLEQGFNVLTGETGAGKSIIIDALGTHRGDRADPTFVRAGTERARVEGVFSISDRPDVVPVLAEYGLWDDEDEQVILSREVNGESGRSVARINGRAVSISVLREVGGRLVDIHGQHEGLSLFNTRTHGEMLDRFGGLLPQRAEVAEKVGAMSWPRCGRLPPAVPIGSKSCAFCLKMSERPSCAPAKKPSWCRSGRWCRMV